MRISQWLKIFQLPSPTTFPDNTTWVLHQLKLRDLSLHRWRRRPYQHLWMKPIGTFNGPYVRMPLSRSIKWGIIPIPLNSFATTLLMWWPVQYRNYGRKPRSPLDRSLKRDGITILTGTLRLHLVICRSSKRKWRRSSIWGTRFPLMFGIVNGPWNIIVRTMNRTRSNSWKPFPKIRKSRCIGMVTGRICVVARTLPIRANFRLMPSS